MCEYEDDFQILREETHRYMSKKEKDLIESWCKEAGVTTPVGYYNSHDKLIIYTDRPGYMIGKAGTLVYKYQDMFRKEFYRPNATIEFVEVRSGFVNY